MFTPVARRGYRWRSNTTLLEIPLVVVAIGPDPEAGTWRGHARGIIAIGDFATGVIAIGGVARGGIAIGGVAIGLVTLGGCGLGVLALGGLALGYFAFGGLAIGYAAVGGLAVGYYAMGGAAFGKYVDGPLRHDPQAVEFFGRILHAVIPAKHPPAP